MVSSTRVSFEFFLKNILRHFSFVENGAFRRAAYCNYSTNVNDSAVTIGTESHVETRKDKMPVYYTPKGAGKKAYSLVEHKNGEQIANYVLFEDSINQATVAWNDYNQLTSEERDIYMIHLQAVEERKLTYIDPKTKYTVFTISHHLQKAKCCGSGCRHCPYEMVNAPEKVRKTKVWNGAFYV
ncbi:unnamed protein product [Auanema sp. JU1783]|nr:unnamed protein product [Auanema sp. JU1783]